MSEVDIRKIPGCISTVVLTGTVESLFSGCHEEMRSYNERNGITMVEYRQAHAVLVEAGRDSEVAHMLQASTNGTPYQWILQIDADATFGPDALAKILHTAFVQVPQSDVVGGYCQLKGGINIPSIDTGSGTWEPHFPGEGVIPVIRTGAHFMLCKRSAFEKLGPGPWFRTRLAWRPIDALAEVDGFARQRNAGRNPFASTDDWQALMTEAVKGAEGGPSTVGEDSGFCDRLKSRGGLIFVDTNIVTGHVSKMLITPAKLKEGLALQQKRLRAVCGLLD